MVICITGMHRSGTSMIARLLNLSGVYLGPESDLISPAADNPEGFWENKNFLDIDEEILTRLGGSWDAVPVLNEGWQESNQLLDLKTRAQALIGQFSEYKNWGWKDPRSSITLPFWQDLIPDLKVVVCLRNPLEVAQSFYRRGYSSNLFSFHLWQSYYKTLFPTLPTGNYIITHYESYFIDSNSELKRLLDFIEVPADEKIIKEVCSTISLKHKHNRSVLDDTIAAQPPQELMRMYVEMCSQSGDVYWGKFYSTLKKSSPTILNDSPETSQAGLLLRLSEKSRLLEKANVENELLGKMVKSKDQEISKKDEKIRRLTSAEYELHMLKDSLFVKALYKYRGLINRLLPESSMRRKVYDLSGKGLRVFLTEGPRGIWSRIQERRRNQAGVSKRKKISTWPFSTKKEKADVTVPHGKLSAVYADALAMASDKLNMDYVPVSQEILSADNVPVKLVSFYLPQFHPIPENDEWWGKGFTEWANVAKAVPQYTGHYQPHLPGELGFYDLRLPDVQRRQVQLAKQYGIYGFSFYYYWFNGKRLLERPLDQFISDPEIDFPFCLCWANENWTRRWDGQENEILIGQDHSVESDFAFIQDIEPYFRHKNYIKIGDRPLLIVYRPQIMPDPAGTAKRWREYCKEKGLGDIYLVAAQTFKLSDPREVGFDAAVEFPPHGVVIPEVTDQVEILNPNYAGKIYNYQQVVGYMMQKPVPDYPLFRTVMASWDNTARRQNHAHIFINTNPSLYQTWLAYDIEYTKRNFSENERFVFINAWNEWAEGAHLEPDKRFGYAYLQSTMDAQRTFLRKNNDATFTGGANTTVFEKIDKTHDTAVILHMYYPELWDEINSYLSNLNGQFDFFISIPESVKLDINDILKHYPYAHIYRCKNYGRDIAPFIQIFKSIYQLNYQYICKIHTKRTSHRENGAQWRRDLLDKLLGSRDIIEKAKAMLNSTGTGLLAPRGHILPARQYIAENEGNVARLAKMAAINYENNDFDFIAGSMFWFKPLALAPLIFMDIKDEDFGEEKGLKDGTLAHAFERFIGLLILKNSFDILEIGENTNISPKYGFAAPMPKGSIRNINRDPIIIYQVGKVGSRTVLLSLQRAYQALHLNIPIHHVHVLENLDELERNIRKNFANPVDNLDYIRKSKELRKQIDKNPRQHWKLISLVREPIARNIGSFFQNIAEYIPDWKEQYKKGTLSLDQLQKYFLNNQSIHIAADWWFDKQLKPLFGIDVFESDFPVETGFKIYKSPSSNASLLLIRLEDLNSCAERAMYEFLGLKDFTLYNTNVGDEKEYADLYKEFKEKPLPKEYIENIYNMRSVRHFYSQDELEAFSSHWLSIGSIK